MTEDEYWSLPYNKRKALGDWYLENQARSLDEPMETSAPLRISIAAVVMFLMGLAVFVLACVGMYLIGKAIVG